MNFSVDPELDLKARELNFTEDKLCVELEDGRELTVPLAWYPRLLHARPEQLRNFQWIGGGSGIHWPDLDEDLSISGLLQGIPSQERRARAKAR